MYFVRLRGVFPLLVVLLFLFSFSACGTDDRVRGDGDTDRVVSNQNDGDTEPGDGDTEPGDGDTEPGDGDTEPGDGDTEPGDGDTEPGDGDTEPGDGDGDQDPDINLNAELEVPAPGSAYYARVAYAGEAIWVTYIAIVDIDGQSEEKVHLIRYGLDGSIIDGPTMIGVNGAVRDYHTAIAADGNTVYIVWVMEGPDGQEIRGRTFNADGTSRQSEPFRIVPALKDGSMVGTIWKPDLAVTNDGNAVLVAEGLTMFDPRVILQRIDNDGALVGYGYFVFDSSAHGGQYDPTVTVMPDGMIQYAYLGGDFGEGSVFQGMALADADEAGPPPTAAQVQQTINHSVRLSKRVAGNYRWLTYPIGANQPNNIGIRTANIVGPATTQTASVSGRISIYSDVAASPTGGAVAWMSYLTTPVAGQIHAQRFSSLNGDSVSGVGPVVNMHSAEDAAWPYGPTIIWIQGDIYALFWSERHSGVFSIHGRLIELP